MLINPAKEFNTNDVSNLRDYRLDFDLSIYSISNDEFKKFDGLDTYGVENYREGIGFGITNIQIETNASLQPIVEITFKDLYGNSVFVRNADKISNKKADYSDIFDWPPPKFTLSYKGYLGKSSKMLLNLKKTDITYNSSDGSFTIKCSFVPNLWGPFADIPVMFLFAIKKLKVDEGQKLSNFETFIDLLTLGQEISTRVANTANKYESLGEKLNLFYGSPADYALQHPDGEIIDGISSANKKIKNFELIKPYSPVDGDEFMKSANSSENKAMLNNYAWLKSRVAKIPVMSGVFNFDAFVKDMKSDKTKQDSYNADINKKKVVVNDNIKALEKQKELESFVGVEDKVSKVVISKLFSRLAGDTGYLLGKILQAGLEGHKNKSTERDGSEELIGKFFPLIIDDNADDGMSFKDIQRPAPRDSKFFDLNKTNEWSLVDQFITAVSKGIADNPQLATEQGIEPLDGSKLKKRINNLEMLKDNPYNTVEGYAGVVANLIIRSGIWAYLTHSEDPNSPFEYNGGGEDDKGLKAAENEVENITDDILNKIESTTPGSLAKLKDVCSYFKSAMATINSFDPYQEYTFTTSSGTKLKSKYFTVISESIPMLTTNGIKRGIEQSQFLNNNGIFWCKPIVDGTNSTLMLDFGNNNSSELNLVSNSSTDAEFNSGSIDKSDYNSKTLTPFNGMTQWQPPGIVTVKKFVQNDDKDFGVQDIYNHYVTDEKSIFKYTSFSQAQNITSKMSGATWSAYLQTNIIQASTVVPINYTVFSQYDAYYETSSRINKSFDVCWDITGNTSYNSTLQRKFILNAFSNLYDKIVSSESNQKNTTSKIENRAQKLDNEIYTQFHHIFYQWHSLIYDDNFTGAQTKGKKFDTKDLPKIIEELYATVTTQRDIGDCSHQSSGYSKGFQYLAPLIKTSSGDFIDVENSIINVDSWSKVNGQTTVLNVIQNFCQNNNFLFFPISGAEPFSLDGLFKIDNIITPSNFGNRFVVLWSPTPESRIKDNTGKEFSFIQSKDFINNKANNICAFEVQIGSTDNALFKNINVSTDSTKTTAESIVNLQKLANTNTPQKFQSKDCSLIPVIEGRSYTCEVETLGNAQISPMQYFYLDNIPIFGGLYQIMGVKHNITPNSMVTTFKGIKMRYNAGKYGGIPPVTLKSLSDEAKGIGIKTIDTENKDEPIKSPIRTDDGTVNLPKTLDFSINSLNDAAKSIFTNFIADIVGLGYTNVVITSGYRSISKQQVLYNIDDKNAKPGFSQHNFGLAIDINCDKAKLHPLYLRKNSSDEDWKEIVDLSKKYNLFWGGGLAGYHDRVHFDLRNIYSISYVRAKAIEQFGSIENTQGNKVNLK